MNGRQLQKPKSRARSIRALAALAVVAGLYAWLVAWSGGVAPVRLIKGTSMRPALRAGDLVVIKKHEFHLIKAGDVIAYRTPDPLRDSAGAGTIVHRVIAVDQRNGERVLLTKGDNSAPDTFPVSAADYQGSLGLRAPIIGAPLMFILGPKGVMFIGVAALLTFLYVPAFAVFYIVVIRRGGLEKEVSAIPAPAQADAHSLQLDWIMHEIRELKSEFGGRPAPRVIPPRVSAEVELRRRLAAGSYPSEVAALWRLHKQPGAGASGGN